MLRLSDRQASFSRRSTPADTWPWVSPLVDCHLIASSSLQTHPHYASPNDNAKSLCMHSNAGLDARSLR